VSADAARVLISSCERELGFCRALEAIWATRAEVFSFCATGETPKLLGKQSCKSRDSRGDRFAFSTLSQARRARYPQFIARTDRVHFSSRLKQCVFKRLDYCARAWRKLGPISRCICGLSRVRHQMLRKYASLATGSTADHAASRAFASLTPRPPSVHGGAGRQVNAVGSKIKRRLA
jgi:hypothetical protein